VEGEITAKGNLNFRKVLQRRDGLVRHLYHETHPAVIQAKV
jgi:feruloyl-CoA synthase